MQWIWASQQIGWDLYSFTYRARRSEVSASCSDAQSCSQIFRSITTEYKQLPKLLPTMLRDEDKGKAKAPKLEQKLGRLEHLRLVLWSWPGNI